MNSPTEMEICAIIAKSQYFDHIWYLKTYPDVASSNMDPVVHYVRYGEAEGRCPSPNFVPTLHKQENITPGMILLNYINNPPKVPCDDNINIIFASNEEYVPYLSVAIASIVANASPTCSYRIYLLYNDISLNTLKCLSTQSTVNVKVMPICVDNLVREIQECAYVHSRFSPETYYRIIIPELFPKLSRCLYLDCDVVVNSNLLDIYKTDLQNYLLGAIEETYLEPEYIKKRNSQLPFPIARYFNAGVLLININAFIKEDIYEKFMSYVKKGTKFRSQDQDILNIICSSRVKFLHQRWNTMWQFYIKDAYKYAPRHVMHQFIEAFQSPLIIHYNSDIKPWSIDDGYFSKYFWKYAKLSPFYDEINRKSQKNK